MLILAGNILGIKEESRAGAIQALWTYIKTNNLQDKVDRKRIHADAALRPVRVLQISGSPMRLHASTLDIWRRRDPIQFLARAGQPPSRITKSRGHQLHSESIYATSRTASSLGYRAQVRGRCIEVKNAGRDPKSVTRYFARVDEAR